MLRPTVTFATIFFLINKYFIKKKEKGYNGFTKLEKGEDLYRTVIKHFCYSSGRN
jgi:hypothetical protein